MSTLTSPSSSSVPYHSNNIHNPSPSTSSPLNQQSNAADDNTAFPFPAYAQFPPFYTLQPNTTTRTRQLELWSTLITTYCAHRRVFRIAITSPPPDLFANKLLARSLKPTDIRSVLTHMSMPPGGQTIEFLSPPSKNEQSNTVYVWWKSASEWADLLYGWVDETGQKGAVLTVYELREGDGVAGRQWIGMDEGMLRKVLNVLVKRGKVQIFAGQGDGGEGVKFF